MRRPLLLFLLLLAGCVIVEVDMNPRHRPPNLPLPTLGGLQFWGDVQWQEGWRIQQHVETGHFRLLDPRGIRRSWGSYATCLQDLRAAAPEPPAEPRTLVVLLHGMGRTPRSLSGMRKGLQERGWEVATVTYPSLRRALEDHAGQLEIWLDRLRGVDQVHFVTHSLGGIVVRATAGGEDLRGIRAAPPSVPNPGDPWRGRIRIGASVFIAPPSHGAALADRLDRHSAFRLVFGATGRALRTGRLEHVPVPAFRFATVAGSRGDDKGWNPWVPGDDDGVVGVDETVLEGADGRLVVSGARAIHTILMNHPDVVAATDRFLRGGPLEP